MAWTSVVFPVPSSPDNPMTAGAVSWAPSASPNRLSSLADRRIGLELQELIAQHRRQLEIQLFRRRLHLLLQHTDERLALALVGRPVDGRTGLRDSGIRDPRDEANEIGRASCRERV